MSGVIGSTFINICIDDSANRIPDACRVIVEGPMTATGATGTPNALIQVSDPDQIEALFGEGGVLTEGLKVALDCCRSNTIQLYALPRANAGTAATYTITVTVDGADPATATVAKTGTFAIYWGEERYVTNLRVYEGMTAADVATALAAALPADFLFTATAAAGVVTLVAKNGGTYGNDLYVDFNWHGRENTLPDGVNLAIAQTVAGAGSYPKHTDYADLLGSACCACCMIHLSDDPLWQEGAMEYVESTWECDKPNCMTMGYTYASGTAEEILGYGGNWSHSSILSHCNNDKADPQEGDAIFPWMKTAAYGSLSCCIASTNPETSIEGRDFGALTCVKGPATCAPCFTWEDREELGSEGFVTTSPVVGGDGFMTSPYIERDISNGLRDASGYLNRTWRDMVSSRLARVTATRLFEQLQQFQGLALFGNGTKIRNGVRGTSPAIIKGKMRAWFQSQVGILFNEPYNLDQQIEVVQESQTMPQCYGDPRKLIVRMAYQPPIRLTDISVTMRPEFDPLCGSR